MHMRSFDLMSIHHTTTKIHYDNQVRVYVHTNTHTYRNVQIWLILPARYAYLEY
jgi:hypothetical protein